MNASTRKYTNVPLVWKMRLPFGLFGILMLLNHQTKKRLTPGLGWWILTTKEKLWLLPVCGGGEDYK